MAGLLYEATIRFQRRLCTFPSQVRSTGSSPATPAGLETGARSPRAARGALRPPHASQTALLATSAKRRLSSATAGSALNARRVNRMQLR